VSFTDFCKSAYWSPSAVVLRVCYSLLADGNDIELIGYCIFVSSTLPLCISSILFMSQSSLAHDYSGGSKILPQVTPLKNFYIPFGKNHLPIQ
jgi:hypothetical protein